MLLYRCKEERNKKRRTRSSSPENEKEVSPKIWIQWPRWRGVTIIRNKHVIGWRTVQRKILEWPECSELLISKSRIRRYGPKYKIWKTRWFRSNLLIKKWRYGPKYTNPVTRMFRRNQRDPKRWSVIKPLCGKPRWGSKRIGYQSKRIQLSLESI